MRPFFLLMVILACASVAFAQQPGMDGDDAGGGLVGPGMMGPGMMGPGMMGPG